MSERKISILDDFQQYQTVAVWRDESGMMHYQIPPPVQAQLDRIEDMLKVLIERSR